MVDSDADVQLSSVSVSEKQDIHCFLFFVSIVESTETAVAVGNSFKLRFRCLGCLDELSCINTGMDMRKRHADFILWNKIHMGWLSGFRVDKI